MGSLAVDGSAALFQIGGPQEYPVAPTFWDSFGEVVRIGSLEYSKNSYSYHTHQASTHIFPKYLTGLSSDTVKFRFSINVVEGVESIAHFNEVISSSSVSKWYRIVWPKLIEVDEVATTFAGAKDSISFTTPVNGPIRAELTIVLEDEVVMGFL